MMGLIRKTSLFQRFLGAELGTRSPHILVRLTTTLGGREGSFQETEAPR